MREQERRVEETVSEGRFRTIGEAVAWCAREPDVAVSYKMLYDWFRQWGYRNKAPQPMAEKAGQQVQEAWKKEGYRQPCKRRGQYQSGNHKSPVKTLPPPEPLE